MKKILALFAVMLVASIAVAFIAQNASADEPSPQPQPQDACADPEGSGLWKFDSCMRSGAQDCEDCNEQCADYCGELYNQCDWDWTELLSCHIGCIDMDNEWCPANP